MAFSKLYLGSYNGSSWTEREKTLSLGTDVAASADPNEIKLAVSKGSMVLGSTGKLVEAPGTDLTGTYTEIDSSVTVTVLQSVQGLTAA